MNFIFINSGCNKVVVVVVVENFLIVDKVDIKGAVPFKLDRLTHIQGALIWLVHDLPGLNSACRSHMHGSTGPPNLSKKTLFVTFSGTDRSM